MIKAGRHYSERCSSWECLTESGLCADHTQLKVPTVPVRSWRVWWACGGALLGAAALLAALALRRDCSMRKYHKHVLDTWRRSRSVPSIHLRHTARCANFPVDLYVFTCLQPMRKELALRRSYLFYDSIVFNIILLNLEFN